MAGLDFDLLLKRLESRFQLSLISQRVMVDGGYFDTLRPSEMEQGNGFAILIARTHRQIEASFMADNFSGALLRAMSEASEADRLTFRKARKSAEADAMQVYFAVNGDSGSDCLSLPGMWRQVDIDVSRRIAPVDQPSDLAAAAFKVVSACLLMVLSLMESENSCLTDGDSSVAGLPEGAKTRIEVNRYERSPVNRAACIEHYGSSCQCCGFDFQKVYGELAEGYIEVHHRTPVSKLGPDYVVDPVNDLIPFCSNCHAAAHRRDPPVPVDELKALVQTSRASTCDRH